MDKKEIKVLNSNAQKICAKIGTCFRINGQLIVSVSSFKSSGFFIVLLYFIHPEFAAFAASISVLKHPKYCISPSIFSCAFHGFFLEPLFLETPIYFEDFLKNKVKNF